MKLTIPSVLLFPLPLVLAAIFPPAPPCPSNVTLPVLDPVTLAWVDASSGSKQSYEVTIPEARIGYDLMAGNVSNPSQTKITTKVLHLPVGPTGNVTVYLYKPENQYQDLLPVVVYFHGMLILAPME